MPFNILIVDDDALFRRSLAFNLERHGYSVRTAPSAEEAFEIVRHQTPDLVLLDISLPGMDGLEALKSFRQQCDVPVIFLTARRRELDEILGLEIGADDYVTKPFDLDVLLAHIKAVLRRAKASTVKPDRAALDVGDLYIDPQAHTATRKGEPLDLSPREFEVLYLLAAEAGRVVSSSDILNQVWGAEYDGEPQVVYVCIRELRKKLEDDPDHPKRLITVRGIGYKLVPQEA
ncbi:MAG: response regulator transcription factor [Anaerolineales bacterium]